jgi:putative flippase GtrA
MTSIVMNAKERTRFFKFAVVGVIGAVVDFGIMNLMVAIFQANLVIAGTISFIAAILSNFTWNRYWTYHDSRSKPIVRQLAQFSIVSIAGLVIRLPILALVEPIIHRMWDMLQLPTSMADFLAKNFTLAIAVVIVMFWNFFINRFWTYNDIG